MSVQRNGNKTNEKESKRMECVVSLRFEILRTYDGLFPAFVSTSSSCILFVSIYSSFELFYIAVLQ